MTRLDHWSRRVSHVSPCCSGHHAESGCYAKESASNSKIPLRSRVILSSSPLSVASNSSFRLLTKSNYPHETAEKRKKTALEASRSFSQPFHSYVLLLQSLERIATQFTFTEKQPNDSSARSNLLLIKRTRNVSDPIEKSSPEFEFAECLEKPRTKGAWFSG
jgi:hypothetical protein